MNIVKGNILDVEKGYIFQQVNCQNAMGSGLAKAIYEKWPIVKEAYHNYCEDRSDITMLGKCYEIKINENLSVINLYSQLFYGNDGKRYTDYGALKSALFDFEARKLKKGAKLYFPYGMGAGLGGGDWNIIQDIIEYFFPNATIIKLE